MSTATVLTNPIVTVNTVDLSNQCTSATINHTVEALEATAFGDTARKFVGGLQNNEVTLTMYMSYASAETYATLNGLVGTTTTITIKPATGSNSATNPLITVTGCYLETLPVINGSMGELSVVDVTFTGGALTKVVI